jgi:phosphoribosylglycinamide formyltransferase 1
MTLKIGVLGSTKGTSLQGVIDAIEAGKLDAQIVLVASEKAAAPILDRARQHKIPALHIGAVSLKRDEYDEKVTKAFREAGADVILLVGYMRIVSPGFVKAWQGRLINVHPSLLPAFGGKMNKDVHKAVLDSGVSETGCTIHIVTDEVDAGPVLMQKKCRVLPNDTVDTLKDRVQALEKNAFVEVLEKWSK